MLRAVPGVTQVLPPFPVIPVAAALPFPARHWLGAALLDANRDGGMPKLPASAERLARDLTVMGTYDEAPDAARLWLEAGADTVDVVLPLGFPEQQLREMLEAVAPAAAGL